MAAINGERMGIMGGEYGDSRPGGFDTTFGPSDTSSPGQSGGPAAEPVNPQLPTEDSGGNWGSGGIMPQYDPTKPVYAGPELNFNDVNANMKKVDVPDAANFLKTTTDIYGQNSLQVQAARNAALEKFGGQGLLFSDMAARGGEGAAFDKSMELARPDALFNQDLVRGEQDFNRASGLANQAGNIAMQQTGASGQVQAALDQQKYEQQRGLNVQNQQLDAQTKQMLHGFNKETLQITNDFTKEMKNLGFSQEMQSTLLATMTSMINNGNSALTMLATSPEATQAEVDAIRKSIMNGLTTFSNIWKASAGSDDIFDFSGIGG